ncbi:MAG TPA: hypothetical protein VH331_15900 [Allosphingosinicella sp.]|jgi:hypothetical protein|nr:hypothetical protein [Allosphingosinicella sp.]
MSDEASEKVEGAAETQGADAASEPRLAHRLTRAKSNPLVVLTAALAACLAMVVALVDNGIKVRDWIKGAAPALIGEDHKARGAYQRLTEKGYNSSLVVEYMDYKFLQDDAEKKDLSCLPSKNYEYNYAGEGVILHDDNCVIYTIKNKVLIDQTLYGGFEYHPLQTKATLGFVQFEQDQGGPGTSMSTMGMTIIPITPEGVGKKLDFVSYEYEGWNGFVEGAKGAVYQSWIRFSVKDGLPQLVRRGRIDAYMDSMCVGQSNECQPIASSLMPEERYEWVDNGFVQVSGVIAGTTPFPIESYQKYLRGRRSRGSSGTEPVVIAPN